MIIVLLAICLSFAQSQSDICPTLTPGPIAAGLCASVTDPDNLKYTIQQCDANNVCLFDPEAKANGNCVAVTVDVSAYPGAPCNPKATNPCIVPGTTCSADTNVCSGAIAQDQPCQQGDYTMCALGLSCLATSEAAKFTCQPPKKDTDTCSGQSECKYGSGCLNNKCTPFFSIANGQTVGDDVSNPGEISYCTSGLSVNGVCTEYAPTATATGCTDDSSCVTNAPIPSDVCDCTWNGKAKQCKLGTQDPLALSLIAAYKNIFANYTQCNADELNVPCNYYQVKPTTAQFQTLDDFSYLLWKRQNIHRIPGISDNTTINLYRNVTVDNNFSQLHTPVDPVITPTNSTKTTQYACPKFVCGDAKATNVTHPNCGIINQPSAPGSVNSTVTLYNLCSGPETCGNPSTRYMDFFNNVNITCQNVTSAINSSTRYPGEPCNTNTDCYSNTCTGNKCAQNQANNTACPNDHKNCTVGYFCNVTVCTKQGGADTPCKSTFECANNMLCITGKCAKAFSQAQNANFTLPDVDGSKVDPDIACVTGRYSAALKTCVIRKSNDLIDSTSKLTVCKIGQLCNYTNYASDSSKQDNITEPCGCGYNENGNSYCPVSDDQFSSAVTASVNADLAVYDNNCHTLNRYLCSYAQTAKTNSTLSSSVVGYEQYHLYYGAPACVGQVLSASALKVSSIVLVVLAALLF